MKALLCTEFGPAEMLTFQEMNAPEPKENEVLIKVAACSANFPDTLIIENKYQFKPELPFSPGGEVAGVILKIGENVKKLSIGQRVLLFVDGEVLLRKFVSVPIAFFLCSPIWTL